MKKITLIIGLVAFSTIVRSQNGLEQIIVEKYYVSNAVDAAGSKGVLPVGSVTYRVYADMLPGYKFQAMYGNVNHTLKLASTTSFFNHSLRGQTTPDQILSDNLIDNTLALDSWFSVGAAANELFGVLKTEDDGVKNLLPISSNGMLKNTTPLMGIALNVQDGIINDIPELPLTKTSGFPETVTLVGLSQNDLGVFKATSQKGNSFTTNSGAISALDGAQGPTPENRILLGQFTTEGDFSFELNIQIGTPTAGITQSYVARNPTGNEISIPSLILAPNISPSITISAPSTANVSDVITIAATASDLDGSISQVEFFVDNVSIGIVATSPYTLNWTALSGSHTIKAIAKDNQGSMTTSSISTIEVQLVGLNELTTSNFSVNVSPNPAKDFVTINMINLQNNQNAIVSIFDFKGSLISSTTTSVNSNDFNYKLDVSSLKSGVYFMNVSAGNETIVEKIVIE